MAMTCAVGFSEDAVADSATRTPASNITIHRCSCPSSVFALSRHHVFRRNEPRIKCLLFSTQSPADSRRTPANHHQYVASARFHRYGRGLQGPPHPHRRAFPP